MRHGRKENHVLFLDNVRITRAFSFLVFQLGLPKITEVEIFGEPKHANLRTYFIFTRKRRKDSRGAGPFWGLPILPSVKTNGRKRF